MSETQQKIVQLTPHVIALTIDPYQNVGNDLINVRSVLEQTRLDLQPSAKLEDVLDQLPGLFMSRVGRDTGAYDDVQLRFVGYSDEDRVVKVMLMAGLNGPPQELHSTINTGIDWFGFADIATRLVKGHTRLVPPDQRGSEVEFLIPTAMMSIRDALDLAETLVRTTSTFGRFVRGILSDGRATAQQIPVGGEVQLAVVRQQGVEWVRRPAWSGQLTDRHPGDPPPPV